MIQPPNYLDGEALLFWQRHAEELELAGLLTYRDADTFAACCDCHAEVLLLKKAIEVEGRWYAVGTNGAIAGHPAVSQLQTALKLLLSYSRRFGLDPESRAKLGTTTDKSETLDDVSL